MKGEELFHKIYNTHIKQLKHLSIPHEKLLICFSGIAGSGKTTIAKILEERYKGVRFRSDDIREIITGFGFKEVDRITYDYSDWFFEKYKLKNKLIILDKGIDRRWKETFSLFKNKDYKIFIIRLDVPERICRKRVIEKLGKLDINYINRIGDWEKQYKEFGRQVKSNIVIKNDKELSLSKLFSKLDSIIC